MTTPKPSETPVNWMIFFHDRDRGVEIFSDEAAARFRYEQCKVSWTCNLFVEERRLREAEAAHEATIEDCKRMLKESAAARERAYARAEAAERQPTHTDHPLRHWDRTCPACVAEGQPTPEEVLTPVADAWIRRDGAIWEISAREVCQEQLGLHLIVLYTNLTKIGKE